MEKDDSVPAAESQEGTIEPFKHVHQEYVSGGVKYPSVTEVLAVVNKPYLVPWANRLGREGIDSNAITNRSASIGTLAHALIQGYLTRRRVSVEGYHPSHIEPAKNAFQSYMLWAGKEKPALEESELSLLSPHLGYGGTIDAVFIIGGERVLVDFKTSRSIHKEYFAQLAAYVQLYTLTQGRQAVTKPINRAMILQLGTGPKPQYTVSTLRNYAYYLEYFGCAYDMYKVLSRLDSMEMELTHVE